MSKIRTAKDDEVPKSIAELEGEIVRSLEILDRNDTCKSRDDNLYITC